MSVGENRPEMESPMIERQAARITESRVSLKPGNSDALTYNIAIVGFNRIGYNLYKHKDGFLRKKQRIVGFINEYPLNQDIPLVNMPNLLGDISRLHQIVEQHHIQKIIIALDPQDFQKVHEVIEHCERERVRYELVSELYDVVYGQAFSQIFRDISRSWEFGPRRIFDFLVSGLLFLLFLPSWLLIALAIKLDSRGPVLYSQERVGKKGKIFRIFKFRSMHVDAEKLTGPQLATANDPRITRVGRFLRKTRLDELPQLINVIKGDMSLIGPRPERPYFVEKYRREIPFYINRLEVKPGLTGLAQVETGYDESIDDVRIKLKYDLQYIEQRDSIPLNIRILFKTLWVVLTAKGV